MARIKETTQARTARAVRIKVRTLAALEAAVRAIPKPTEEGEATEEGEQKPRPDPNAIFAASLSKILEEELNVPPNSVERAAQIEALMHMVPELLRRIERNHQEQLLNREILAMVLEHQIHGTIKDSETRGKVFKALGVEPSRILAP